jgi:tetratricopeptide (TPR) repeat protein
MTSNDAKEQVLKHAKIQLKALVGVLVFSLFLALGCGATIGGKLMAGAIAAAWGFAFFLPAFIVGMLFGIPKRNDGAASDKNQLVMNGNFAQISDWITKMITGVTLVSAKNIPGYISAAGSFVGNSLMGSKDAAAAAASTGSAIAVLFSGLGFIAGYLFTSVYLTVVLELTAQALTVEAIAEQMSATDKSLLQPPIEPPRPEPPPQPGTQEANLLAQRQIQTVSAAQKLQDLPVDPTASAEALELLGNAKMSVGKFEDAAQAFAEAIKKNGAKYRLRQSVATALFRLKKYPEAVEQMERARPLMVGETSNHILAFYDYLTYYCLYLPEPASYQKCLLYVDEFLQQGDDLYGGIAINCACAYGLKAAEKRAANPAANIDEEAVKARANLDKALKLAPNWRTRIEQLMDPKSPDHDLAVFVGHRAFDHLFDKAS